MVQLVVLDANALFGDLLFRAAPARSLLQLCEPGVTELHLSPVVIAELRRKYVEVTSDLVGESETRLSRLHRLTGADLTQAVDQLNQLREGLGAQFDARLVELLSTPGVERQKWPAATSRELAERELDRRRPFIDLKKDPQTSDGHDDAAAKKATSGTVGHRDTLIWLGVLELLTQNPDNRVALVTADKGFLDKNGLHPHLREDLSSAGVTEDRVELFGQMTALVGHLESLALTEDPMLSSTDYAPPRHLITSALQHLFQTWSGTDFTYTWDERSGGYEPPEIDLGLPSDFVDAYLLACDGPEDVQEGATIDDSTRQYSFTATLTLSANMDKSDWYSRDADELELWDADVNDHFVNVEVNVSARFVAEIYVGSGDELPYVKDVTSAVRLS